MSDSVEVNGAVTPEVTMELNYHRHTPRASIRLVTTCPPDEWWATVKPGDTVTLTVREVTEDVRHER